MINLFFFPILQHTAPFAQVIYAIVTVADDGTSGITSKGGEGHR